MFLLSFSVGHFIAFVDPRTGNSMIRQGGSSSCSPGPVVPATNVSVLMDIESHAFVIRLPVDHL
jgi:hypothetical protein